MNFVFNPAKGRVLAYAQDVLDTNVSKLIAIPLIAENYHSDGYIIDSMNFAQVDNSAGAAEHTFLGRKVIDNIRIETDRVANQVYLRADPLVYENATGVPVGHLVVCHAPTLEIGLSPFQDDNEYLTPLMKFDFSVVLAGQDIPIQWDGRGMYVASGSEYSN